MLRHACWCVALVSCSPSGAPASGDAGPSDDASDARVVCPAIATACPDGCVGTELLRFDPMRSCLVGTGRYVCAGPPPLAKCYGLPACRVGDDGTLFKVASVCMLPGLGFCAGAEDTKVLSAPACP